jgi:hypothetical protein
VRCPSCCFVGGQTVQSAAHKQRSWVGNGHGWMVALTAPSRGAAEAAHAAALMSGGTDEGAVGLRLSTLRIALAYARDPDGNKLHFVARGTQEASRSRCADFQVKLTLEPPMRRGSLLRKRKVAPPSGEGRGHQSGTLLSPVLEEKYRTLFVRAFRALWGHI